MTIRGAVGALCVALALVGCSSEAEPRTLPPAPSTSPSPTQAEPLPVPSEAMPETAEGAAAFARYYLDLVNRALKQGDAAPVRRVSDPACGGCRNLIGAIEETPAPGERIEGGQFQVMFAEAPPVEEGDVIVDLQYVATEVRVYGADGSLLRTTPATAPTNGQLRLVRREGDWIVMGFRSVES